MFWNHPLIKYFVEVCTYITLTVVTRNPQVWSRWLLFRHLSVSEHLFTSGAFTTSAMVVVWWCVHHARVKSASVYSPTVRLVYCSVADEQRRASRVFVFEFRSPSHWNPHVTANTFFFFHREWHGLCFDAVLCSSRLLVVTSAWLRALIDMIMAVAQADRAVFMTSCDVLLRHLSSLI